LPTLRQITELPRSLPDGTLAGPQTARNGAMTQAMAWTRREVWTRKLLYPGHTLPTALAPILVAVGLALHDRVFSPAPVLLAFIAGWLIQFAGVVTDNYTNLVRQSDDREHPELVEAVKGKNTVAVRFGKCASRAEFSLLLALAHLAPFWFWQGLQFSAWVLLPLVTAPLALMVLWSVWVKDRRSRIMPRPWPASRSPLRPRSIPISSST
jgi:1,4-dihydroxy-2-naphthoate octaprenyltransferase